MAGRDRPTPAAFRAVAVDGKTCRGARRPDGSRVHLFSIVDQATGVPLGQVNAGGKDHEIAAFAAVLDRIDLTGLVVTADALHTQKAHARYLHRQRARYIFIVKRNQPRLHDLKDSIEAHLTIVFAALAIARHLQTVTGLSIRKIVHTLRPIQQIRVTIAGHTHLATDPLPDAALDIQEALAQDATH